MSNLQNFNNFSDSEELDTQTPAPVDKHAEQEEIFLRAVNGLGEWKTPTGKLIKLFPFSYHHRRAAYALGVRLLGRLTEEEIESLDSTGYYPGIDTDAVLVTWLCTQPGSEVEKATRMPTLFFSRALKFGEAAQIEPGTKAFDAAIELMSVVMTDFAKSQGKLVPANGKKPAGKKSGKR
jgi:hypothetical protein